METDWLDERIGRVEAWPTRIPLRENVQAPSGEGPEGKHLFVRVETESGAVGWGEARPPAAAGTETVEWLSWSLKQRVTPQLVGCNPFAHREIRQLIESALGSSRSLTFLRVAAAVETALWDLCGRLSGLPLHVFLGGKRHEWQPLTYTIVGSEPEAMARCAFQWREARCLKVELTGDPERDAERLRSVQHVSTHHLFWLDGKQSYTASRALDLLHRLQDIPGVVCIEQPLPGSDTFGMASLRAKSPLPVAMDEGVLVVRDLARAWALQGADMVVLKVGKAGGLRNAGHTAEWAETMGLECLGSGSMEAGVGFTAAVHLFSTHDLRLPAELNGPQFLEDMLVDGLEWDGASVRVPDGPGLGVTVREDVLQELRLPSP